MAAQRSDGYVPAAASRRAGAVALMAAAWLLAGCGAVSVKATEAAPTPLIDQLPLRAGLYYSAEFRDYVAREARWNTKWEIQLGGAHVTQINRLAKAMFATVTPVADLTKPPTPPLDLILEPRFEEYAFVTPKDAGSELFAVTIKYRVNVYDGEARLIDSLVFTGFGNETAGNFSNGAPLAAATQKAMRDAGAKFTTEFADQPVVQKLLRHEPVEPIATATPTAAAPGAITEVRGPSGPPPPPKPAPAAAAAAGATAAGQPAAAAPPTAPPDGVAAPAPAGEQGATPAPATSAPAATPEPPPPATPAPAATPESVPPPPAVPGTAVPGNAVPGSKPPADAPAPAPAPTPR